MTVFLPLLCLLASLLPAPPLPADDLLPPPVAFRQRTLPNGLTLLSVRQTKSPTVALQVWYRVGSKDDPPGRSGFAHLFEHLMFKRTKNLPDEMFDRLTEDVGGENNAFTLPDATVYHEVVPSNHLERLLWAEAERMGSLQVDESNFVSEREVVKEEYRQGVLAPPYGTFDNQIDPCSFTLHPYRRPTIGNIAELDAATLEDVRAFHRAYYRPDNVVLVVAGDFDEARLDAWVDRYFGPIPRPDAPLPSVLVREPARAGERRSVETAPNLPLPALALTYLVPPAADADAPALKILDALLSDGESSRLYRSLVYRQRVASEASSYHDLRTQAGLLVVRVVAASGQSIEALEKATLAELERLRAEPVSAEELARVKTRRLTGLLRQRETAAGLAAALGEAALLQGGPERIDTEPAALQAVTAADIRRVAERYLAASNRVVVQGVRGPRASPPPSDAPPVAPARTPEADNAREAPPAPAAARRVALPAPAERTLANGLRAIVVSRPGSGLVSARALVRAGAAHDPASLPGLADFTASLLTRGTATRSAVRIAEEIEALGGTLEAEADWDGARAAATVARSRLDPALAVLADLLQRPAFAGDEIERRRTQALDGLRVAFEEPATIARAVAARLTFGRSAYGHLRQGLPASLPRIRRRDILRFHQAGYRPSATVLVLAGDLSADEGFALAEKHFGAWRAAAGKPLAAPSYAVPPTRRKVVVVDRPGAGQAAVVLIRPAIARRSPEYVVAQVANSVFGGGYSSRLNAEIRIKRGLSYGAGSQIDARRGVGPLTAMAQTKNETAALVAGLLASELEKLANWPLLAPELEARKASLTGPLARTLETAEGLSEKVGELALHDLPLTQLAAFFPAVEAVTTEAVRRFAAQRLGARYASLVVVGEAKRFLPELKRRFGTVRVVPFAQLNLEGRF